jgi:hypothetical protein
VTGPFATATIFAALAMAAWAVVLIAVNRPINRWFLGGAALLELMLVAFAVGGIVQMLGSERDFARTEFVAYLVATAGIPPAAAWWMRNERGRGGTAVLLVVFLVTPVLVLRVQQVWAGV